MMMEERFDLCVMNILFLQITTSKLISKANPHNHRRRSIFYHIRCDGKISNTINVAIVVIISYTTIDDHNTINMSKPMLPFEIVTMVDEKTDGEKL